MVNSAPDESTIAGTSVFDYVIVGSGINSLVAAAMLGRKGHKVLVLERNAELGGCLRTEEVTQPGFVHDVMAMTVLPFLQSPGYRLLGSDLRRHGLEILRSERPTGVLLPDGRAAVLSMDRVTNVAMFDALAAGDGSAYEETMKSLDRDATFIFSILGTSLWSGRMIGTLLWQAMKRGPRKLAAFFGEAIGSARAHLDSTYRSEVSRAVWAPWVLHTGLEPEAAYSGQMAKVMAFSIEAAGCPIVKGGVRNLVEAFRRLIETQSGALLTNTDVDSVVLQRGRARGVRAVDGQTYRARRGIICSVTPNQLYGRLLRDTEIPAEVTNAVSRYRYGRGDMQIHYALSSPPKWKTAGLDRVAILHLTSGLDGVSRAANEANRSMLPAVPTICVGQPAAVDKTRVPPGGSLLWLQLLEIPRCLKGDADGSIEVPQDGAWTENVRELFADRVEAILAAHIDGFRETVLARRAYSPSDLAAMNINLVGGDPYGGSCSIDQFFLWRPFTTTVNHRTHVRDLHQIGASTHPGPGLGGDSGYLVASKLG
jgi:phytoene dehydrogenase-like protein